VTGPVRAPLDRAGIQAIIPHRAPFLLVDEVVELAPGEHAAGVYHVAADAWYLRGHFPGNPIMPGVLQVEALAQTAAVCGLSHPDFAGRLALFAGIDDVRFRQIVRPGDLLRLEARIVRLRGAVGRAEVEASVDGEPSCRGVITFALTEPQP
jgi:3-hydroxyacyl-[acyl-carrier-protein] dehydratase